MTPHSIPKGRVLITAQGMNTSQWSHILGQGGREVVLEPAANSATGTDPSISYAVLGGIRMAC